MSFEVSTTSPSLKRILVCESSMPISASPFSISRCTSPTALRGTMTPGIPAAPGGAIGKIAFGQRLQREARAAGAQREARAVARGLEQDLRAFRELAHDVVEHVRRHGGGAGRADLGRNRLDHFEVEVGGFEREL